MGVFVVQILGAVAQLERSMIRERSIAGQVAARERGREPGRRRVMHPDIEAQAVAEYLEGEVSYLELGKKYGVTGSALKRAVYRKTKPQEYNAKNKV
jgi:DNA invertase Pin-like site-specific DNA recombinase